MDKGKKDWQKEIHVSHCQPVTLHDIHIADPYTVFYKHIQQGRESDLNNKFKQNKDQANTQLYTLSICWNPHHLRKPHHSHCVYTHHFSQFSLQFLQSARWTLQPLQPCPDVP